MENHKKPLNLNPGSVFLTLDDEKGIVSAQTKNGGDDNFMRYILKELENVRPGRPIPERLIVRYDMGEQRRNLPEIVLNDHGFYTGYFLPFTRGRGIPPLHLLTIGEAVFCLVKDIPLTEAYTLINDESCKDFLQKSMGCAPDISSKVAALRDKIPPLVPGYCYVTYDEKLRAIDMELTAKRGMSYKDYIQRNLDRLEPGKPLTAYSIVRYSFDDITPLKNNPLDDRDSFIRTRLTPTIWEQKVPLPEVYDLSAVIYCILHKKNPLTTTEEELMKNPEYFNERRRIMDSVPARLNLQDAIPVRRSKKAGRHL